MQDHPNENFLLTICQSIGSVRLQEYQLGVAELKEGSLAWLCSGREFGYKDLSFCS